MCSEIKNDFENMCKRKTEKGRAQSSGGVVMRIFAFKRRVLGLNAAAKAPCTRRQ